MSKCSRLVVIAVFMFLSAMVWGQGSQLGGSSAASAQAVSGSRPVYISGIVKLEDGTIPSGRVVIERLCGGRPEAEGYTDSDGRFGIQLGRSMSGVSDASFESEGTAPKNSAPLPGTMRSELNACMIRASFNGFVSDLIPLAGRRDLDNPDLGVLVLHPADKAGGPTVSAAALLIPKDAQKAYEKGVEEAKKQQWGNSEKAMREAIKIYPKYAAAWQDLGSVLLQEKHEPEAREAFAKAIEVDPQFTKSYLSLATLHMQHSEWPQAAESADHLIKVSPAQYPQAFFISAVAHFSLSQLPQAETSAREAVRVDPDHKLPKAEHVLGLILATEGKFQEALPYFQAYLEHAPNAPDTDVVKRQIADVQSRLK